MRILTRTCSALCSVINEQWTILTRAKCLRHIYLSITAFSCTILTRAQGLYIPYMFLPSLATSRGITQVRIMMKMMMMIDDDNYNDDEDDDDNNNNE